MVLVGEDMGGNGVVVGAEVVGPVGSVDDEGFLAIFLGVREVFAEDLEVGLVSLKLAGFVDEDVEG